MRGNRNRSVGSPASTTRQDQVRGTANDNSTLFGNRAFAEQNPELVITAQEMREWYRRNPHVRPGVLEGLAARGVLVIVPDGFSLGTMPAPQGVRA